MGRFLWLPSEATQSNQADGLSDFSGGYKEDVAWGGNSRLAAEIF
jgi:hypothetical protein